MTETRYKVTSKTYRLRFEDRPGLEVVMRSLSVGELLDMADLADAYTNGKATGEQSARLFVLFADRLVSWNIDGDDDKPVPGTAAGVRSLAADLFLQIFEGWFTAMNQAAQPAPPAEDERMAELVQLPMTPVRAG